LQRSGSRDMAALIFVAIVRALGIPARLVSSLQCVPWAVPKDYPSKTRKPKTKATSTSEQHDQDAGVEDDATFGVSSRIGSPNSAGESSLLSAARHQTDRSVDHSDNPTRLKSSIKRKRGVSTESNPISTIEANRVRQRDQVGEVESGTKVKIARPGNVANRDSPIASPSRPTIKLRRARPTGHVLGTAPSPGGTKGGSNDKQTDGESENMVCPIG
jgi:hypothetical protein